VTPTRSPREKNHSSHLLSSSPFVSVNCACQHRSHMFLPPPRSLPLRTRLKSFLIPSVSLFPRSLRPSRHSSRQLSLSDSPHRVAIPSSIKQLAASSPTSPRLRATRSLAVPPVVSPFYCPPFLVSIWLLCSTILDFVLINPRASCLPPFLVFMSRVWLVLVFHLSFPSSFPGRLLQTTTRSPCI